eukprot:CAMPEP_0181137948 /NCGR_PEP_ID=MMETSP1071-20121207/33977_1 /TAXON_ID=35127 /ORGANISM="Thalassiosira sp., Strain NH16" /LENGTH=98 /DNA_ID=CAMNT_0023224735 /DNA_START=463 /DNA_END=760 /DNA_ORIENTATION=+
MAVAEDAMAAFVPPEEGGDRPHRRRSDDRRMLIQDIDIIVVDCGDQFVGIIVIIVLDRIFHVVASQSLVCGGHSREPRPRAPLLPVRGDGEVDLDRVV